MNDRTDHMQVESLPIDPELDRAYREHALAAALRTIAVEQPTPVGSEAEEEAKIDSIEEARSTFGGLR